MKSRSGGFNIYLLGIALALIAGCKTGTPEEQREKELTTVIRFYVEVPAFDGSENQIVEISGVKFHAGKAHVVDEASVDRAVLIPTAHDGYAMEVQFDSHGKLVLDSITSAYRSRHLLIFTQFGTKKSIQDRWLAAPLISKRMTDGVIRFTPNATREEVKDIVKGLNNLADKRNNKAWWM